MSFYSKMGLSTCVLLLCGLMLTAAIPLQNLEDLLDMVEEDLARAEELVARPMEKRGLTTVIVTSLNEKITREVLLEAFEKFGEIKAITKPRRSYAFVMFADEKSAAEAAEKMNKTKLLGQTIYANVNKPGGGGGVNKPGVVGGGLGRLGPPPRG